MAVDLHVESLAYENLNALQNLIVQTDLLFCSDCSVYNLCIQQHCVPVNIHLQSSTTNLGIHRLKIISVVQIRHVFVGKDSSRACVYLLLM